MNELALFAGAGGGILAGQLLGWRTVCAVERDAYAAAILAQRQNDGCLEPFPIWSDVETFDGRPWRGIVDVVSGGFPCQDISAAGKGAGIEGERSGLWVEMARIIGEVRPRYAFVENSPMLTSRGLGVVLGDLAALGFDARWGVLGAADVGAPHKRERIWIVAEISHAERERSQGTECETIFGARRREEGRTISELRGAQDAADANRMPGQQRRHAPGVGRLKQSLAWDGDQPPPTECGVGGVVDGVAYRLDRLKAIGNGQVPKCAAEAWRLLSRMNE